MDRLPLETLKEIFGFLGPTDLFSVARVCKTWNRISSEDSVWKRHAKEGWSSDFKSKYFQLLKTKPKRNYKLSWQDVEKHNYLLKLILVGDPGVGKISIMKRFTSGDDQSTSGSGLGVDYKDTSIDIYGKQIKLQIWDTAGPERFKKITSAYYKNTNGIMFVFDVCDRDSFKSLEARFQDAEKNTLGTAAKILVGHKQDEYSAPEVTSVEAKALAAEHGCSYIEVSARNGTNVTEAFIALVKEILPEPEDQNKSNGKRDKEGLTQSKSQTKDNCVVS